LHPTTAPNPKPKTKPKRTKKAEEEAIEAQILEITQERKKIGPCVCHANLLS
jgi:hypothetical protein